MTGEVDYEIARNGLATAFAEAALPPSYAASMKNRYINVAGGAEKRQGVAQLGNSVGGNPTITGLHELVTNAGSATLFASGNGVIYKFNDTSAWSSVYTSGSTDTTYQSVQFGDKLIFVNGTDRNIYTKDGTTFSELIALVEQGSAGTGTSAAVLVDPDITNWILNTDVAVNDLLWNRTKNAYGVITAITSASISCTPIGGAGSTGIGVATSAQEPNDAYQIIDLVELNIIPSQPDTDNVAVAASGSTSTVIAVSGLDFSTTEIALGDIIYNTTRNATTKVQSVSANINVVSVSGQTVGDSLVFLKSAMPIASRAHVHYGRLYLIDSRDKRKIRISGADDPQDFTTDAGTLDSVSFSFGNLQPQGDTLISMGSFQRFFVAASKQNIFAYEGTNPVKVSAADTLFSFAPIGMFPQGCVAPNGLVSIGNDMTFVTPDGLQSFAFIANGSNLNRANLSEPIRTTLRDLIKDTPQSQIFLVHYPRRSWLLLKVGTSMYCYNYTTFLGDNNPNPKGGSWSFFDNVFAQQNTYLVRANGDLVCAGSNGKVYKFDADVYSDDGIALDTEYKTGWLTLEEPKKTKRLKQIAYISPIFDVGGAIDYTIRAEAGFDSESTDEITISTSSAPSPIGTAVIGQARVGGSPIQELKFPLRVRGDVTRITISNSHSLGPDIINRFALYANLLGRR